MWGFQTSRRVVERLGSYGAARGVAGSLTGAAAQNRAARKRAGRGLLAGKSYAGIGSYAGSEKAGPVLVVIVEEVMH